MPQQLDRAGTFRAQITDYCLMAPFKSGAIPVSITAQLLEMWDPDAGENGDWVPWEEYNVQADGMQWLIKKDGSLNEGTAQNLMNHAGWDGDFDSLTNRTWAPPPCQVVCKEETDGARRADNDQYGRNNFSIAFVNAHDTAPGGQGEIGADTLAQLKTQHGASLRALKGNTVRNAAPPKGKPAPPPKTEKEDPGNAAFQEAANSVQKPPA